VHIFCLLRFVDFCFLLTGQDIAYVNSEYKKLSYRRETALQGGLVLEDWN